MNTTSVTSAERLYRWAHQVQEELRSHRHIILTEASLAAIAARMREQVAGWATFEDGEKSYDDYFDFTLTLQGVDLFVSFSYHAERDVMVNYFPEFGVAERIESLCHERVYDILVDAVEDTDEVLCDTARIQQLFLKTQKNQKKWTPTDPSTNPSLRCRASFAHRRTSATIMPVTDTGAAKISWKP